jgi:REP element-mobilizing transposase RayT
LQCSADLIVKTVDLKEIMYYLIYKVTRLIFWEISSTKWGENMVRTARQESDTGYYHVMARGNNKEMIFRDISEKQYFLEELQAKINEGDISLLSYCVMDNHMHLLIFSDLESMTDALKRINIKFAMRYNTKYNRVGHVFQDRYKSEVINTGKYLLSALRYIHNNPVKAKIVSRAKDYKWSSYKAYINGDNDLINPKEQEMIIDMVGGSIKLFEQFHLEEDMHEFIEIREDLEREREERARRIIDSYCRKYNVDNIDKFHDNRNLLEEIIIELIQLSKLSHRRIAEITGINRGIVHNIAKKL